MYGGSLATGIRSLPLDAKKVHMDAASPTRTLASTLVRSSLGGAAFGIANALLSFSAGGMPQSAGFLLGLAVAWCLVAFLCGYASPGLPRGALAGFWAMVSAVCCFFGAQVLQGAYTVSQGGIRWAWLAGDLRYWLVLGMGAGLGSGLLGAFVRRADEALWGAARRPGRGLRMAERG